MCVCVCVCVEKVKRKKNMFYGVFIDQRVLTSIFFECISVLPKLFQYKK